MAIFEQIPDVILSVLQSALSSGILFFLHLFLLVSLVFCLLIRIFRGV